MASRRRAPYTLGDWFVVPLADGRFAPGRVVRNPSLHRTLSYIFMPLDAPVGLETVRHYRPRDAIGAFDVSGLEIGEGWALLGGHEDFDVTAWPLPEFEMVDFFRPDRLEARRIDDRFYEVKSWVVPMSELGQRQQAGTMGSVFLEHRLPILLEKGALLPVGEQVWWPGDDGKVVVSPDSVGYDDAPLPSKVVVVLPGPELAWDVEDYLHDGLPAEIGEVDGNLWSPDGAEILVYTDDPTGAARRIAALLSGRPLPEGAHLRVEIDGEDTVIIPLGRPTS